MVVCWHFSAQLLQVRQEFGSPAGLVNQELGSPTGLVKQGFGLPAALVKQSLVYLGGVGGSGGPPGAKAQRTLHAFYRESSTPCYL